MPITLLQGDDLPCNIFSSLGEYGLPILEYLTYKDGNALRATCKEARKAVEEHKWMDSKTHIKGSLKLWRTCFRNAKAVNISDRKDLKDDDFVHLKGIHTLNMSFCEEIYDEHLYHLKGIHTLDMRECSNITAKGYVHLRGIHTLIMHHGNNITDDAFAHLEGIHTLDMHLCFRNTSLIRSKITDKAFVHLKGIHTLNMLWCDKITDKAFVHLKGIHTLNMGGCKRITDAALVHLKGIHTLHMQECENITGTGFVHLNGIHTLDVGRHYTRPKSVYRDPYINYFEFIGMKVLGYGFPNNHPYHEMDLRRRLKGVEVEITRFVFIWRTSDYIMI